ncbi:unnamed protein product [Linum trigynum]|uniref:Uncharacterized protein n=1 Tax=Linum trigynum TaxID=586398 RepID=A0AAV2F3A6_9ROSI
MPPPPSRPTTTISSRRSLVFVVIMLLLQIWAFSTSSRATATRILPRDGGASPATLVKTPREAAGQHSDQHSSSRGSSKDNYVSNREHFGRSFSAPPTPSSGSADVISAAADVAGGGGFEESKRKVPSCPDPLHN